MLAGNDKIKNFIFATADKSYLDGYDVETLVDISGLTAVGKERTFNGASAIENILIPAGFKSGQETYNGCSALKRVWAKGDEMPEGDVIDLSKMNFTEIDKGFLNGPKNVTVILPESFVKITDYALNAKNQASDTGRYYIFGNNNNSTIMTVSVANWTGLNAIVNDYYDAIQNYPYYTEKNPKSKYEKCLDNLKLTYNDVTKTVLEWRADFPAQPTETPAE